MKWIQLCSTTLLLLGLSSSASAGGLFGYLHGDAKCCDTSCTPDCCAPTIQRPCHTNVYSYQRHCADTKPRCCDVCDVNGCAPCCEPACAAPCCETDVCCDGGRKHGGRKHGWRLPYLFGKLHWNKGHGCDDACCDDVCCDDPCKIACLIYRAQTACYAKDRADAIDDLGDDYRCECNPEIMTAFVYALNDCDERVRKQAADEIGDQIRRCKCCCTPCVVSVLKCALADCDRGVRHEAEEALEACGYCVVDGNCCCDSGCDVGCVNGGGYAVPPAYDDVVPGPAAPPEDLPAGELPMDLPNAADGAPAKAPSVPSPSARIDGSRDRTLARLFGLR